MAPSMASVESETAINVSQNAHSSPSQLESENVQVGNSLELVEDSVEIPKAYRGGPVQPPQSEDLDEVDEFYSLSPQGKASAARRQAAANKAPKSSTNQLNDSDVNTQRKEAAKARNAVDELLERGATVHKSGQMKKRKSLADADDEPDELQVDDDGLSAPIGSHVKASQQPTRQMRTEQNQAVPIPSRVKSHASTKVSSLAALQARKQMPESVSKPKAPPLVSKPMNGLTSSKSVLPTAAGELNTPARSQLRNSDTGTRPTTGKLPSRKSRMLAQTPARSEVPTLKQNSRSTAANGTGSKSNVARGKHSRTEQEQVSTRQGCLNPPVRAQPQRQAKRDTIYDLSESPDTAPSRMPRKRPRVSKTTTNRKAVESAAKSSSKTIAHRPLKQALDHDANKRSKQLQARKVAETSVSPGRITEDSVKSRMKSKSEPEARETVVESVRTEKGAKTANNGRMDGNDQASRANSRGLDEDWHEFENAVVQYSPHDQIRVEKTISPSATAQPSSPIRGANAAMEAKRQAPSTKLEDTDQKDSIHRDPGGTQENAIVLSDRNPSTSPSSTVSLQHFGKPSANILPSNRESKEPNARQPKTPRVLPSSPPLATGYSVRATRPEVDTSKAQKSTIISFGKSGPRNQGSLPVRKNGAESAWTDRSSLPPTATGLASSVGSRARLEAKRRKGPPSTTTSVKSFRSSKPAPPSNVAENVADALASFIKKPVTIQKKRVDLKSPSASTSNKGRNHDTAVLHSDSGADFTNMNDYDEPTLAQAKDEASTRETQKHDVKRTESRIAMPPPAPKGPTIQKPQRTPTVPLMLGSDTGIAPMASKQSIEAKFPTKRASYSETANLPPSKRQRIHNEAASQSQSNAEQPSLVPSKVIPQRKPRMSQAVKVSEPPKPQIRTTRKPSRQISQGSQKVDIHGSPVPQGMVLADKATVLETFSQQAGLSSDVLHEEVIVSRTNARGDKANFTTSREQLAPPSHQPEIMSSNRKSVPAEPEAESQSIIRIVRADSRQPLVEDQTGLPSTDPFTSSEENRKQPRQGSSSSNFLEQLRRQTEIKRSAANRNSVVENDPDKTLVEPEQEARPTRRITSRSTLSSTPSSTGSDESTASMPDLATWRNALQPHQRNLFDEMVTVAHRLLQHTFDKDTATTNVIDDYRRSGQNLVEQMELNHARQHQKYINALTERKKRLRKDFTDCSKKLSEASTTVATAQRERKQAKGVDTVDKLETLMATFC